MQEEKYFIRFPKKSEPHTDTLVLADENGNILAEGPSVEELKSAIGDLFERRGNDMVVRDMPKVRVSVTLDI